MGHFALFAFLRGIFQCLWKTASLKQNLTYRKGKSDMVLHQYASSYFVSRRHIFVILQNFSSLFWRNQLVRFTCTVTSYNTSDIDGNVAEWYRCWTVPLHAHRDFVKFGFDTGMRHFFFSWFSFSFIICASFWNAFCFNIIIQTF